MTNLLEILYAAYNSKFGILVETSDPSRLRQKLYAERRKDPDLACLSFRISPTHPNSQLMILKVSTDG